VFVPIYDDNKLKYIKFQYVTLFLIALNIGCFTFEQAGLDQMVIASFALVPAELIAMGPFGGHAPFSSEAIPIPEALTLITYMFFHGDPLHIAGNMLFLWVFGDNVEDACGHARFLALYLACGVIGGLVHVAFQAGSNVPLVGASGAVAGVIAAYLVLHPRVRVWVLAFKFIPLRISAAWLLGAWISIQVMMVLLPQAGPIAWWAHIGGIVAGAILVILLRRPGVPLFDQRMQPA
jgi:membrane associated rhomboid family serine protease